MQKFKIAVGESRKSINWKNTEITWEDFLRRVGTPVRTSETYEQFKSMSPAKQGELKDVGGFVAGTVKNGRRKAENIVDRCMITLDADNIEPGCTQKVLQAVNVLNYAFVVYSTRKHHPSKPRLRIIFPTSRPMLPDEYEPIARYVAKVIGMSIMDKSTFETSRLMYWPSCSVDSDFVFCYNTEPRNLLDVEMVLDKYSDWKDINEWPKALGEETIIKKEVKRLGDPREKDNIVGEFCSIYDVHSAIENFLSDVYELSDNPNTYHHVGSTAGYSAIVYDDGQYMYSYHATDPACKICCNSFDLVRIHKFGYLDAEVKEGVSGSALPSYKAMCKFADSIPEVHKLGLLKTFTPIENFDTTDDWFVELETSANGGFKKNATNIMLILENDPRIKR